MPVVVLPMAVVLLIFVGILIVIRCGRERKYKQMIYEFVRVSILPFNPADAEFARVTRINAAIGIGIAISIFALDAMAGFPEISSGSATFRGFYILLIMWGSYVLCRDHRKDR